MMTKKNRTHVDSEVMDFQQLQYAFSAHIRNPEAAPLPEDIEDRRMQIYRELFYNNIEGFISSGFPVLRKLYNDEDWHTMVRHFFIHHPCSTPYFLEISEEFLRYLQAGHQTQEYDPPFLQELAHYEWVELALSVSPEEIQLDDIDPNGDLLQGRPAISPLAWALSYQWPIHTLGPDNQPTQAPAEATHIVVYRDRQDKIRFVIINQVTAILLNMFEEDSELTGQMACEAIAQQKQHPQPNVVIQGGLDALENLKAKGIILGIHR